MTKFRGGRHFSTYVIADANSGVLGFVDIAVDLHPGTFVQQAMKGPIRPQRSAIWFDTTFPSLGISLPDAERNLDILSDSDKMEKWSSPAKQSLAISWLGYEPWQADLSVCGQSGCYRKPLAHRVALLVRQFMNHAKRQTGACPSLPIGSNGITADDIVLIGLVEVDAVAGTWQPIFRLRSWFAEPQAYNLW
ncbi:hypothetical protein HETIRDRAFT_171275 [Heterobasidion irregulare TC 32-1]|uniref:Uncharacterized protein n=1 Tax=Heterobasidion irregulare (strain TC 32-1) TaxID=747525 RepID=W4KHK4_HETIT|nr:uncharacterized protein HETIRDRAFT_171275 [Heterobasidion irregulare TC 32-1]ETW84780.1 hypothetical protein HETIRDRAFT_171275 [Heterobasidion irregulare TC 32-1]